MHSTRRIFSSIQRFRPTKLLIKRRHFSSPKPSSIFSKLPSSVRIVEVGPRDGLQNESSIISLETKVELINKLSEAGIKHIECGSFVSPKWVPQMSDSEEVFKSIKRYDDTTYAALVPNMKGLERALSCNINEIAVFASASESFSQKNINCSIVESIERFKPVVNEAKKHNIPIRGYVSCVLGCPYEGDVSLDNVLKVSLLLYELGCYEISLGDTIGVGTPYKTYKLLEKISSKIPLKNIAVHFHDTYGQALANILTSLQYGINIIDSSISGLGGCPYAIGASGNVATEDVIYMLNGLGINSNIDLKKLLNISWWISKELNRKPSSKVSLALQSKM